MTNAPDTWLETAWRAARPVERAGYIVGATLFAAGLLHLGVLLATGGSWYGPLSLRKPVTFGLSFGLSVITIVCVASWVRLGAGARACWVGGFIAASAIETALVTLQAWRGVPSHFNLEAAFDVIVTRTLAGGGGVLVACIVALTIAAFRRNPATPPSMRIAIRAGFITLCGALAIGGLMIASGMRMVAAGDAQTAYETAGTLKPAHAVLMHGILLLPLHAWLLSLTIWDERRRVRTAVLAVAGYVVCSGVVTVTNVLGLTPDRWPWIASVLAALGAGAFLAAWLTLLRSIARNGTNAVQ